MNVVVSAARLGVLACCLAGCARDQREPGKSKAKSGDEQVVATVGQRQITVGDVLREYESLEPSVRMRFSSVERKKELLRRLVHRELLAAEAKKRGLGGDPAVARRVRRTLAEAMAAELRQELVQLEDITEEDVRAYYDRHRDERDQRDESEGKGKQGYAQARQSIRNKLFKQRRADALAAYVARLRSQADIQVDEKRLARLSRDSGGKAKPKPPTKGPSKGE